VERLDQEVALFFEEGRLAAELAGLGAPPQVLGPVRVRYPWTISLARKRLDALLERERFDAVIAHSPWVHALVAPVVKRRGPLLVHFAHGFLGRRHWLERWASWNQPDLVVANSQATALTVPSVFPEVPCVVIHPPVAPRAPSADRSAVREALETRDDAVVVVNACRLEPCKGHSLLVEALSRLQGNYVAWIAGGVQKLEERKCLDGLRAQAPPWVRFLGHRTDVPDLLSAADIYCQPNVTPETFGISFVEAMLARLPVVTTRMGGALEVVDETCGVLVEPDRESVTAALTRLGEDPATRAHLGANGPGRARLLCDPTRQAQLLREALEASLARGGVGTLDGAPR
jgi:glycosyltransferase involved in cell wall biosynthesis